MNEDIHKELNELSPFLAKLKKNDIEPKIDEAYWRESEELLVGLSKITKIEAQKNIEIPSQYWFDSESVIVSKSKLTVLKTVWYRQPMVWSAIAAVFCTILVSIVVLRNSIESKSTTSNQEFSYSQDELWEYIEQNPQEFTIEKLIDNQLIDSTLVNDLTYAQASSDEEPILMESEFQF